MTRQRELILSIIRETPGHLSAAEIFRLASERMPGIAIGTVYRNLSLLTASGEIRRIECPNAPDLYDKNVMPHDHVRCVVCGRAFDIQVGDLASHIERLTGVRVITCELNATGVCPECSARRTEERE